jgi:lipopolysaccharide biosynthesis glycosyltransferase
MQDEAQPRQYADQDALNCVLRGRFAMLDDGWNRLSRWCKEDPGPDAKILHFAGPEKPWHADYRGIGSTEWRAVHAASPFSA